MKRALSFILAALTALSLVTACVFSVGAEENLFQKFDLLQAYVMNFGASAGINPSDIGYWVERQYSAVEGDDFLCGTLESGVFKEDKDGMCYSFPADKFEAIAHRLFDFEGTLREMIERDTDQYPQLTYDAANDRFIYQLIGKGGVPYRQNGYVPCDDGSYDVYFQSGDFVETENDYYIVWEENYYMLNVTIDEPLLKVNGGQQVNKLPEGPKFLPYEEPKNIIINAVDGVSFEIGDDQLPVGTEVTAVKPDDYDVEAFKSAIRGLSESIEVYGISAKVDGAPAVCSGEVEVTFTVPESLPLDGLKLFTISPANGSAVDLPVTVDTEARTATAKIDFKSYYFVLCTADGVNGDINGDGRLDTKDLIRLMKHIAAKGEGINATAPDLNGDGNVTTIDLVRLMKMIAG